MQITVTIGFLTFFSDHSVNYNYTVASGVAESVPVSYHSFDFVPKLSQIGMFGLVLVSYNLSELVPKL